MVISFTSSSSQVADKPTLFLYNRVVTKAQYGVCRTTTFNEFIALVNNRSNPIIYVNAYSTAMLNLIKNYQNDLIFNHTSKSEQIISSFANPIFIQHPHLSDKSDVLNFVSLDVANVINDLVL